MKHNTAKSLSLPLISILLILSGCEAIDSAIEIKTNVENQVTEITNNINQIQANLNNKKEELDKKLQELEDAKKALSQLFGSDSPESNTEKAIIQQEIQALTKETEEIKNTVLEDSQNIEILQKTKQEELSSSGTFSIE